MDCFEGHIIGSVALVVFFAVFLLREWVLQNDGANGDGVEPAIVPPRGAEADPRDGAALVEHAVERLIAAQHHMEAVVEGEDDDSDTDSDRSSDSGSDVEDGPNQLQQHVLDGHVAADGTGIPIEDDAPVDEPRIGAGPAGQGIEAVRLQAHERAIARERQMEMIRRINERGIQRARAAEALLAVAAEPELAEERDDADDDLDGILEAVGMHGPLLVLLQNSLLFAAWMCAGLGVGICLPFMIGKTLLLTSPIKVIHLVDRIADSIVDFALDRLMPVIQPALSTRIAQTLLSPFTGLGSWSLKQNLGFFQQQITPVWIAMFEVSTQNTTQEALAKNTLETLTEPIVPGIVAGSTTNGTTVYHLAQKWSGLAQGNSSGEKTLAILVGYGALFAVASWCLSKSQHISGSAFRRFARRSLHEIVMVLKIAFFLVIEMVVFPVLCGVVIGIALYAALRSNHASDSQYSVFEAMSEVMTPGWTLFIPWVMGTAFMFGFATLVVTSRDLVRPGVMWFFRDPNNNQDRHPVQEILVRPFWVLTRKLCTGMLMYFGLIIVGIALPLQLLRFVGNMMQLFDDVFPSAASDSADDILTFDLIMRLVASTSIRFINPMSTARKALKKWWQILSRWLRLSSYMFGREGNRFQDEEGHYVYRTWSAWIMRSRPPISGAPDTGHHTVGSGEELDIDAPVIFVRDGGLYRVPNSERIRYIKNRRFLIPVDEFGRALDPMEDLPGEVDPYTEQSTIVATELVDPRDHTTIVYGPPNFKLRLQMFVLLLWVSITSSAALSFLVPLATGRVLVRLVSGFQLVIQGVLFGMPHLQMARDVRRVFMGNNPFDWNPILAIKLLLLPLFSKLGLATVAPVVAAKTITRLFGIPEQTTVCLAYPVTASVFCTAYLIRQIVTLIGGWSAYVRDQEYLVGRRLNNMQDHETVAQAQVQEEREKAAEIAHTRRYNGFNQASRESMESAADELTPSSSFSSSSSSPKRRLAESTSDNKATLGTGYYPSRYGIRTDDYDSDSESESFVGFPRSALDDDQEWESGSIASRTRSRRSQRLGQ
ncbi:hypothetical protein BG004_005133, partial [Podila humilis]